MGKHDEIFIFCVVATPQIGKKEKPKRKKRMGKHNNIFIFCVVVTPQIGKKKKNAFAHFPFIVAVRETRLRAAALLKIVETFALVRKSNEKGDF